MTEENKQMYEWRHYEDPLWAGGGKTVCVSCKYAFADGAYHHVDEWKYCPMCGAKMMGKISFETNAPNALKSLTNATKSLTKQS